MTLAVMGYHFQVMTRKLLEVGKENVFSPTVKKGFSRDTGGQGI
jgi:hypothetical protein